MAIEIRRLEDGNEREREDRRNPNRVHVSRSIRIVWAVYENGEWVIDYTRLKDARRNYPDATIIR